MAMALAGMGGSLLGAGLGLFQTLHSNKLYNEGLDIYNRTPFPQYTIPSEEEENKALATTMAMTGMPEAQRAEAENAIGRNQAFGLNALQSGRGGAGDVNALVGEANDANLKLAGMSAQERLANQGKLLQVNNQVAGYRDKAFQINKLQRYLMRIGMASSLMGSGAQGVNSGLNMIGTSLGSAAQGAGEIGQSGGFKNAFNDLF